ncbi:MAG: lipid kinase [Desulfurivibrionaceae bacterium]|nr:lipid kinase [Desulfurivibrionaceae bacterium]
MTRRGKALLLRNRKSRSGASVDLRPGLDVIRRKGVEIDEISIGDGANQEVINSSLSRKYDFVIVGGGDGTLNCMAEWLVAAGRPVGIIPLGTGNDLARTLDIPCQVEEACRVIAAGNRRKINLGRVNDKYFFNAASIGVSSKVARNLDPENKKRWGALAYRWALLKEIYGRRDFRAEISSGDDGEPLRLRTIQITVGNGKYYGGGQAFSEESSIYKPELGLFAIVTQNFLKLLKMAPLFMLGRHTELEQVIFLHGKKFVIHTRPPQEIDADGELLGKTPAFFDLDPDALEFFVPAPQNQTSLGGEKMSLMREKNLVALDNVVVSALKNADHYEEDAARLGGKLASYFKKLANRRREAAEDLGAILRRSGDMPKMPDRDRESFEEALSRLKAFVASNEEVELLRERVKSERELAETVKMALDFRVPEESRPILQELEAEIGKTLMKLRQLIDSESTGS